MGAFLCCSKLFWVPFEWNRGVSSVDFREYGNKGLDALTMVGSSIPTAATVLLGLYAPSAEPIIKVHNHVLEDGDERHSNDMENWLLHPMRESNLQLFALVSIWISRKMHDSHPLSVKCLKSLGDKMIKEQHFTTRDFLESEVVLMQVNPIELWGIATVGKLVNFEACTDIMDLLYEKDHTSALHNSPKYLAALMLACAFTFLIFVGHLDDMPMVRRSAATNLGKFAATVEPAHLKTDVMLIFEDLTGW
ncbi:Cyclin-J18 [Camellia lanceoleosa]|uniref:Cyclin-J18 n=1 Tax=Camellia lanceoleosa TaxID=1840588 RepID=A0ACC0GTQ5_9ERIC|nr:Cyclin-J18 [Camellia lanceoleosa]